MKTIQNSIARMIANREQIWQQYDRADSNRKDLSKRFANYYSNPSKVTTISSLTSQQLPPAEIEACLDKLEETDRKINQEKANIEDFKNDIESLKIKARNLIIGLGVGGAFLLFTLFIFIKGNSSDDSNSSQLYQLNAQKNVLKLSKQGE
ncbi:MAG: hypothetical protein EWV49_06570 [Microcystis aeruginosa Ma_QC_Ch_20071001_S25]|jgi:hypothetical protein|uniref:Uncharacterized protein n=2 Tax=Microcystis aeruginosa TaxID=1126 RepID=A0A552FN56_MICAE|nr:MAG: hypothetical protein EHM73_02855 [Chroococcales cyanobacterium metabat2.561]TRT86743.1 MAG: hypothetical protein EWV82_05160 [Microcystis aeruginosa Ma_AC_P_19900807_S299]TRU27711.1 MAG: hypothetical protein EWV81_06790 [Microcystis aeruginosa Ma_SC_T_19800800_S464]TRU48153.1 MAG: hypothetical protein EWV57_15220 [Microcystis aeruginosa Ma_QC_Ch_20071001_S25D]TRU51840.1 MAG: hypothetical protein EWV49_06570 [Microcystis aeruginosa Ma_QC_Ch_20071001_S25]TRU67294.1 MAG: hypothetical prot